MFYGFLEDPGNFKDEKVSPAVRRRGLRLYADSSDPRTFIVERERSTLAFRGLVYGAPDARKFLEPLLNRFEEDGDATGLFRSLEGDFALFLFDHKGECAYLGRDCFARGEIYWSTNPGLSFFTHPGHFFRVTGRRPSLNVGPLWDRFAIGAITPPETVYEDVYTPVAGEYVRIDRTGDQRQIPYWSPLQAVREGSSPRIDDVDRFIPELRECFLDRVREEILPYRRLGAGLSGGMDSGAILGAARRRFEGDLVAVTVGPDGPSSPDLPRARLSAKFNNARHIEFYPAAVDLEDFPNVMGRLAQPFRSGSVFMNHQIAKRVYERGGDCVLWGFGADLIFGNAGYCRRFFTGEGGKLPPFAVTPLISLLQCLPQTRAVTGVTNRLMWHRGPADGRLAEKYFRVCKKPRFYQERQLFRESFLDIDRERAILDRVEEILGNGGDDIVERLIEADFKVVHMYHQISGAHQVCRLNRVDSVITYYNRGYVELNLRITNGIRQLDGWNKFALREAFRPFVHPDIYHGGRGACIIQWDRIISGAFREAMIRYLGSSGIIREIFKTSYLPRLERMIRHPGLMYLNLLGLALWHDVNFRGVSPETPLSEILDYEWREQDRTFDGSGCC